MSLPNWGKIDEALQKQNVVDATDQFKELQSWVSKAAKEEIVNHTQFASMTWDFLIQFAAKRSMHRRMVIQTVNRLAELPTWAAVYVARSDLRSHVQDLHADLQVAFNSVQESWIMVGEVGPARVSISTIPVDDWPEWEPLPQIIARQSYAGAGEQFSAIKDKVQHSTPDEIGCQIAHAEVAWKFLFGMAAKKKAVRNLVKSVIERLREAPGWLDVFNDSEDLKSLASELHQDLQDALGKSTENIEEQPEVPTIGQRMNDVLGVAVPNSPDEKSQPVSQPIAPPDVIVKVPVKPEPILKDPVKVTLKLTTSRPVCKHLLAEFPENLDVLDDVILENLVTDGSTFSMTVAGAVLTEDKLAEVKALGEKFVVHIAANKPVSASNRSQQSENCSFSLVSCEPRINEKQQQESMLLPPRRTVSPASANSELKELHKQMDNAIMFVQANGTNLLVEAMKHNTETFKELEQSSQQLINKNERLGHEAKALMQKMAYVFDEGLTELTATRTSIGNMGLIIKDLVDAISVDDSTKVRLRFNQMERLAAKLADSTEKNEAKLQKLRDDLMAQHASYSEKARMYGNYACGSKVASGVSAVGGASCAVGAYSVGVSTAAVAATEGTAAVVGWFSVTPGIAAVAGSPAMWNPVGLTAAGFAILFLGSFAFCSYLAGENSSAEENTDSMGKLTEKATTLAGSHQNLWNGVLKNVRVLRSNLEDMDDFGPEDKEIFQEMFSKIGKSFAALQQSVDEYLVYVSESGCYPVTFDVCSVVGHREYNQIKALMDIKVSS